MTATVPPPSIPPLPPVSPPPVPPPVGLAGRPGRVLVLLFGGLLTVALIGSGTFSIVGAVAHEETTSNVSFEGPIRHIRADLDVGSIELTGREGSTEVRGVRRVSRGLTEPTIRERVEGDTLVLDSDCPGIALWCHTRYGLQVPEGVSVQVRTSSGDVSVTGLAGRTEIKTTTGDVTVGRTAAELVITTTTGDIAGVDLRSRQVRATSTTGGPSLRFIEPPDLVEARATAGDIDVVVPADRTAYRVDAETSSGDPIVRVPTDPASTRHIKVTTSAGDVSVVTGR